MSPPAASFRDPVGSCFSLGPRILRHVRAGYLSTCQHFLQTPFARRSLAEGQLIPTRALTPAELEASRQTPEWRALFPGEIDGAVFEHERVAFQSYPYEWPPEMLWQAGCLTVELALAALADGYGLKDATPYNVLYRGPNPVFIDLTSFEPRAPGDPLWNPYGQFVRTFLLPLLANRQWGLSLAEIFITHRDGLEPQELYRLCGMFERLSPRIFSLVSMPTWLRGKARAEGEQLYRARTLQNAEKARFILESLLRQLRRSVEALQPRVSKQSLWSDYMATHSYTQPAFAAKERFVQEVMREFKPAKVLDVGANTGHFSAVAAKSGAAVVAVDIDPACVGTLWRQARAEKLNILPLVVDLSRPSPALGWRNAECPSFLDRAAGGFDAVMMLAVVHHLLVTERVPLASILELAAEMTTSLLVIEYVAPEDEMFRQLTRGRQELHANLNEAVFERACAVHFEVVRSAEVPGAHRRMYCLKRKTPGS